MPLLNLRDCTSLQTLHLVVPHYSNRNASPLTQGIYLPGWQYVDELLSYMPPSVLSITFIVQLEYPNGSLLSLIDEWNTMDWEGISESLGLLTKLRHVRFLQQDVLPLVVPKIIPLCDELRDIIRLKLRDLYDLGLFRFDLD